MYAQYSQHTEAFIIGNRDGLIRLKNAIVRAIDKSTPGSKNSESTTLTANDGEDYEMIVICNETPWGIDPSWNLHSHYTAEEHSTEGSDLFWPADIAPALTLDEFNKFVK